MYFDRVFMSLYSGEVKMGVIRGGDGKGMYAAPLEVVMNV